MNRPGAKQNWILVAAAVIASLVAILPSAAQAQEKAPPEAKQAAMPRASQAAGGSKSCLACHADKETYQEDVHSQKGFGCTSCHGGDASLDDMNAMSPARGFKGKITRARVPELCGSCHSDANFMRNYAPRVRVDQLAQYRTSGHGKRLAAGNTGVATCIDCHGVHGIRQVSDPRSSVYPIHQPETCGRCHAGSERKDYEQSVHWELLSRNREMAAPACATCHGSHGAAPPNVASVVNVCGTCHVMLEDLFQKSPHGKAWGPMGLRGCLECHSNHKITRTSDTMVSDKPGSLCVNCHADGDNGLKLARAMSEQIQGLKKDLQESERHVTQAEHYGMEVSDARLEVGAANQALVQTRVVVHGLNGPQFSEKIEEGRKAAQSALKQGQAALHERNIRRQGLLVSISFICLTMVGLYFTIRHIERRPE